MEKQPFNSVGVLLWEMSLHWKRRIERELSPYNLTFTQFYLLIHIDWYNTQNIHLRQNELANLCSLDVNVTSQVLRKLEKKDFVDRFYNSKDERSKYPVITDKARALIREILPIIEKKDTDLFASLPVHQNILEKFMGKLQEV